jgi:hypothetical protein
VARNHRSYQARPKAKALKSRLMVKHFQRYPERARARKKAWEHKSELMGTCCEDCGSTIGLVQHHPDYSQPLLTKTLCTECHSELPVPQTFNPGHCRFKIIKQEDLCSKSVTA